MDGQQQKCGGGVEMGGVESENIDTYSYVVFIRAMTQDEDDVLGIYSDGLRKKMKSQKEGREDLGMGMAWFLNALGTLQLHRECSAKMQSTTEYKARCEK
eukprot:scaffold15742_cov178-Skeletonema_marinoi.AAC.10